MGYRDTHRALSETRNGVTRHNTEHCRGLTQGIPKFLSALQTPHQSTKKTEC